MADGTKARPSRTKARTDEAADPDGEAGAGQARVSQISGATAQIVTEAGALLDEEMAAGIVAARRMQERFDSEHRLETGDFKEALQRFQSDGHALVDLLNDQATALRSDDNAELSSRLVSNVHDLVDLAVGLVTMGSEVANQLIETNLPKPAAAATPKRPPSRRTAASPKSSG